MLFEKAKLDGVVTLHKNSFQPDTGVRTCIIFLTKKTQIELESEEADYPIFLATSQKVGQDSEGKPIFKVADDGTLTDKLDHDFV